MILSPIMEGDSWSALSKQDTSNVLAFSKLLQLKVNIFVENYGNEQSSVAKAHRSTAMLYFKVGAYHMAIDKFEEVNQMQSMLYCDGYTSTVELYYYLGFCYSRMGKFKELVERYFYH